MVGAMFDDFRAFQTAFKPGIPEWNQSTFRREEIQERQYSEQETI